MSLFIVSSDANVKGKENRKHPGHYAEIEDSFLRIIFNPGNGHLTVTQLKGFAAHLSHQQPLCLRLAFLTFRDTARRI